MSLVGLLQLAAVVIAGYMLLFWLASLPLRNVSIVDIGWGLGFVLVAWITFFVFSAQGLRTFILLALVTVWGIRLGSYLAWRNLGEPEDRRYAVMRAKHDKRFWWVSLLTVFGLQGIVMWVVALPLVVGIESSQWYPGLTPINWLGIAIWMVGLVFEAGGDWQLARFKSDTKNQGKICDQGFWRYTRHPNYFGDFCIWWGIWLVSISSWADAWTIVSPLLMSLLLMKVSGVSLLESDITERRPAYADYIRRTNAFFPWAPREN